MMDRMNEHEEVAIENVADAYDFVVRNKDVDLDTPIFRYLPVERYLEMIENGVNVLAHLSLWEDPYEAFILRAGATYKDGEEREDVYEVFKNVYGQSWTLLSTESDVFWRAVGKRGDVVRIRTTVRKLADSIRCERSIKVDDNVCIAPVEYCSKGKFAASLMAEKLDVAINGAVKDKMEFFFVKRKEFSMEKEVRVIVLPEEHQLDKEKCTKGHLLKFHINPEELIEAVLVDPGMDRRKYEQIVCRTRHISKKINVGRSELFDWPTLCAKGVQRMKFAKVNVADIPDGVRFRDYLIQEHISDGNAYSIWSRVRRVFRHAHISTNVPLPEVALQALLDKINDYIPNVGSANDCKTAIRHYRNALFCHAE